ncbi:MAG: hypothetical protein SGBAC_006204 [Bacillariaceae sp.]
MGAEPRQEVSTSLETRPPRRNRVVAPNVVVDEPPDAEGEYYKHGVEVGSRMMSVAAKRIVELEQALQESQQLNATMEQQVSNFYEDKIAKLHRAQMYSVDRMGQRIDVLEEELQSRTTELETTRDQLVKAVEKVVALQQDVAVLRNVVDEKGEKAKTTATANNNNKVTFKPKPKRRNLAQEEKSYPSSAGSEAQFTGIVLPSKKKRCNKVESKWDDTAIVPDSFMTSSVDSPRIVEASNRNSNSNDNSNTKQQQKDASGLSRFFQFGLRNKESETSAAMSKPSELTVRPNVIDDFYDICSNGSLPDTIMFGAGR